MKLTIFGASGMLGTALVPRLAAELATPSHNGCDISNAQRLRQYMMSVEVPDIVINCAGAIPLAGCSAERHDRIRPAGVQGRLRSCAP
ncbi:hypothetical protein LCGC14_1601360 [marine sediment metagenome]|uniref:RmlD-like substrate binding domain-containing protein n=1 Tax=marine sediment metagenome TaxID=412755 RepID=A0A0F9IXL7_9ZZZZ